MSWSTSVSFQRIHLATLDRSVEKDPSKKVIFRLIPSPPPPPPELWGEAGRDGGRRLPKAKSMINNLEQDWLRSGTPQEHLELQVRIFKIKRGQRQALRLFS